MTLKQPQYELALFAGIGGSILAGQTKGWRCIGAVEKHRYAASVLLRRQNEGLLPPFPVWDDVCTFRSDNQECSGFINYCRAISSQLVITAGFPCQDISRAGKGAGINGARSGLFFEAARIISEIRPGHIKLENAPTLPNRGLDVILGTLAKLGYNAAWGVLGADDAGAPHLRKRCWVVAHADGSHERRIFQHRNFSSPSSQADQEARPGHHRPLPGDGLQISRGGAWPPEPPVRRMVDGFPYRLDRVERLSNAQVPRVAAMAWDILNQQL